MVSTPLRVGVLGLQGSIAPHLHHFKKLGVEAVSVRSVEDLQSVERLLLPGGESSTMLKLLVEGGVTEGFKRGMFDALRTFANSKPVWGICAGAILLASEVTNPPQESCGVIPIRAERNSYGTQLDSFKASVEVPVLEATIEVDFIRAPRLFVLDSSVEVLAQHGDDSVLVRRENVLCSAFHTELGDDSRLHEYFLKMG